MSNNIIITIGREYGSGGNEIGRKVAEQFGIEFYDRRYFLKFAEELDMDEKSFNEANDSYSTKVTSILNPKAGKILNNNLIQWDHIPSDSDRLYNAQKRILTQMAEEKSFVIVGRCANSYLREKFKTLDVFIYAPMEDRVKTVIKNYGLNERDAMKRLKHIDKIRREYYWHYTNMQFGDKVGYDMMINSSVFGIDETATHIFRTAQHYFLEEQNAATIV